MSHVKDPKLAAQGRLKIEYAESHMPALLKIRADFKKKKPFRGLRIAMALHVTKETAVLVETLQQGGAKVAISSCNPLSTQDDVAAALAKSGTDVFAYKGENKTDYYKFLNKVLDTNPHITIDDGCDLITLIHTKRKNLLKNLIGGCEETTTGINRLHAMERDGALKYPIIAVNDNKTKHLTDNYYGTGQSSWDGILRATNILIAGKTIVVAGYGDCGKGVALRGKGMGAHVIVTEINPFRALQATLDGFRVMKMSEAVRIGDIFITVTGGKHVIAKEHFGKMKSGAILANAGHFDIEIDTVALTKMAKKKRSMRPFLDEYTLAGGGANGKKLYLVADGRLCNLGAAEGHPSEVMALSFAGQALACKYLVDKLNSNEKLPAGVHTLPESIDDYIASLQLNAMGISIDKLTTEQEKYNSGWMEGT
ncbi:MAG: adenosylhomocysteinase [Patescibacteria group bacterium]